MYIPTGKFRRLRFIIELLLLFVFLIFFEASADISFVVNPSVTTRNITHHTIKEIFLGKMFKWEDGRDVQFILLKHAAFHADFTVNYLNKTPLQFENYWRTLLFSGKGIYPENAGSIENMILFVEKNKGAISYISSDIKINNRDVVVIDVPE